MNEKKIKEVAKAVADLSEAFNQFQSIMGGGPGDYYFEKLMGYYDGCMKAAKFKVGDKARLNQDIEVSGGWSHCGHFMKKGAKVKIKEVDYDVDKGYSYYVEFDKETYMANHDPKTFKKHKKPVETPVEQKHHFGFAEKYLKEY
jgi:hypothetical protein